MAQVWEHNGYQIDEGLKPRDGNFKSDHYQYFFLVKKDGERVMKFCIWSPRKFVDGEIESSQSPADFLRLRALQKIKDRIDEGVFENTLLELSDSGHRMVPLDRIGKKME